MAAGEAPSVWVRYTCPRCGRHLDVRRSFKTIGVTCTACPMQGKVAPKMVRGK